MGQAIRTVFKSDASTVRRNLSENHVRDRWMFAGGGIAPVPARCDGIYLVEEMRFGSRLMELES
jgi:hypothetical protein